MGLLESLWDDGSFASKEDIACGTITCANWPPASLYHIGATVHVSTDLTIDSALAADLDINLLGPFYSTDADVTPPLCLQDNLLPCNFC